MLTNFRKLLNYQQLVDEIRKLNLNQDYPNPNHDKKLINFFYNLKKSNELEMKEVWKTMEILTNDFSKEVLENIDVAYYVFLLET